MILLCPCGRHLRASEKARRVRCPHCAEVLRVAPAESPPPKPRVWPVAVAVGLLAIDLSLSFLVRRPATFGIAIGLAVFLWVRNRWAWWATLVVSAIKGLGYLGGLARLGPLAQDEWPYLVIKVVIHAALASVLLFFRRDFAKAEVAASPLLPDPPAHPQEHRDLSRRCNRAAAWGLVSVIGFPACGLGVGILMAEEAGLFLGVAGLGVLAGVIAGVSCIGRSWLAGQAARYHGPAPAGCFVSMLTAGLILLMAGYALLFVLMSGSKFC